METIFKIGMEVYDSLNFPNKKGFIKSISRDNYEGKYPIIVEFKEKDKNDSIQSYTLEGVYKLDSMPTLSTKPYRVVLEDFEQKAPIPTYGSVMAENIKKGVHVSIMNGVELTDEITAKAFEALAKLIWLRDYYNEGWQPDWRNDTVKKYCIINFGNCVCTTNSKRTSSILSFKTSEILSKFFEEQRELLDIAKSLL